ncbi:MAG: LacI family DNA-binding transcriptional regulator [Chloroflexi bacterium]|nr:LacI family DNA-binding transcriptional regulator [Chloroflexota bacterium]
MATTIGDVARRAGVSTATVSRVLSGIGRARPETHARVEAAARELGFRPSDVARSLKRRSTLTLGLIVTDIENPYFPQLVKAVEVAAIAEGYVILLSNADEDREPGPETSYLDLLVERRVDGLIVAASTIGASQGEWLATAPLPAVLVNTAVPGDPLATIVSDNRGGGRAAAQHLLDLGHRRFGYLMPPPRNLDAPERLAGACDALAGAGLVVEGDGSALSIAGGAPTVTGGESAMTTLLDVARPTRPTGIVAYNDLMAIGAMRAIRSRGLRVPADISLVGFDDVAFAAYVEPALTTLRQETAEMGRWAVATLTELIRASGTARPATPRRVVPVHLEIRASTGPPPTG